LLVALINYDEKDSWECNSINRNILTGLVSENSTRIYLHAWSTAQEPRTSLISGFRLYSRDLLSVGGEVQQADDSRKVQN